VDAALEGLVKGADAVGREDQDAVVVLEEAEEDCGMVRWGLVSGFAAGSVEKGIWTHLRL
jgi:hypothetical protein